MLLVKGISQLLTLAGPNRPRVGRELQDVGLVSGAALLVDEGKVVAVGPEYEVARLGDIAEVVDAQGRVVTPGLVDAHTHLAFGGNRCEEFEARIAGQSYAEIASAGGGIQSTVEKTRALNDEQLLEAARKHRAWCTSCGTTTMEAKSGYGLNLETELRLLRTYRSLNEERGAEVVPTFLGAHSVPKGLPKDVYVQCIVEEMLPAVAGEDLAEFCDIFLEAKYFDVTDARLILGKAKELGMQLRMHVDQLTEGGGAKIAAELRAKTADHLEMTGEEGFRALKGAGVQPVLLPGSVYGLGLKKYPEARAMIEAGLAVVIATDFNPGSSPSPSLPMAMSLACTQMRMLPSEAMVACTINAAHSLNRGHDRGSLEVGKRADFVVWDCEDYREIAYWFGFAKPHHVFVDGRLLFGEA